MGTVIKQDDGVYTFEYWLENVEPTQHKTALRLVEEVIYLSLPALDDSYLETVRKVKYASGYRFY